METMAIMKSRTILSLVVFHICRCLYTASGRIHLGPDLPVEYFAEKLNAYVPDSEFKAEIHDSVLHSSGQVITASLVEREGALPSLQLGRSSWSQTLARGEYNQSTMDSGWDILELATRPSLGESDDGLLAEAAGYLEGYLTARMIWDAYRNVVQSYCNGARAFCEDLFEFLASSLKWAKAQCGCTRTSEASVEYWHQYGLILQQIAGMVKGYNAAASRFGGKQLMFGEILLFSIEGDLITLEPYFYRRQERELNNIGHPSCSALVKIAPSFQDVFFAHTTWDNYVGMLRIYKLYDLQFTPSGKKNSALIPGHRIGFSSRPMNLQSTDDFYTIGTRLAVMETTIGTAPDSDLSHVRSHALLSFFRVQIANRLGRVGGEWAAIFAQHNSGTYNNQWIIFDYNQFVPGSPPTRGALTVLEQIPGVIHYEDMSEFLNTFGFWPSFNVPFSPPFIAAVNSPLKFPRLVFTPCTT